MAPNPVLLLVEDETALREALGEFLEASGFTVLSAETAEQARQIAKLQPPDAVLTDLSLPDLKGDVFLEIFHQEHPHCLLFVHSGDGSFVPSPALQAMGLTPHSVFFKPTDLGKMASQIRQTLKIKT